MKTIEGPLNTLGNILIALLLLFGIVGCATTFNDEKSKTMLEIYYGNLNTSKGLERYDDMKSYWRAEAINLKTGEKLFYGSDSSNFEAGGVTDIRKWILDICENRISKWGGIQDSETRCVLSRYQDRVYFNDLSSYKNPKKVTAVMPENVFNRMKNYREARKKKEKKQKEIILAGLTSRCESFGWSDTANIAACVQQEASRDLQFEKQRYEIKLLENKLVSAQSQTADDEPLFLIFLNAYAESKESESISRMKKDIISLKSKSTYSGSSAEAALKSLYRDGE